MTVLILSQHTDHRKQNAFNIIFNITKNYDNDSEKRIFLLRKEVI